MLNMAMFRATAPAAAAPAAAAYPACPHRCCQPAPSIKTGSKTSLITKPKSVGGGEARGKGEREGAGQEEGRRSKTKSSVDFCPLIFILFTACSWQQEMV